MGFKNDLCRHDACDVQAQSDRDVQDSCARDGQLDKKSPLMLVCGAVFGVSLEKMSKNSEYSLEKVCLCSENSFKKMLKRKIEGTLAKWKSTSGHKPLVIMGIRQCGKTFIAQHFAEEHYKTVVYIIVK